MSQTGTRIAVFPGSFDPITNGHLDVIRRGMNLFDELIVAVGHNPDKASLLPQAERIDLCQRVLSDIPGVRVEGYQGLTVDFARQARATAILRGLRDSHDLQYEFQVALTNRVVGHVETVFIMTGPEYAFTSSSLIRQIATMGGDISPLVPPEAVDALARHMPQGEA